MPPVRRSAALRCLLKQGLESPGDYAAIIDPRSRGDLGDGRNGFGRQIGDPPKARETLKAQGRVPVVRLSSSPAPEFAAPAGSIGTGFAGLQ